jgi:hypothetical protein
MHARSVRLALGLSVLVSASAASSGPPGSLKLGVKTYLNFSKYDSEYFSEDHQTVIKVAWANYLNDYSSELHVTAHQVTIKKLPQGSWCDSSSYDDSTPAHRLLAGSSGGSCGCEDGRRRLGGGGSGIACYCGVCFEMTVSEASDHRRLLAENDAKQRELGSDSNSGLIAVYQELQGGNNITKLSAKLSLAFDDIGKRLGLSTPTYGFEDVMILCATPADSADKVSSGLLKECAVPPEENTSLFNLRNTLDSFQLCVCFVCIIAFTIILEWCLDGVEEILVQIKGVYHLVFAKVNLICNRKLMLCG